MLLKTPRYIGEKNSHQRYIFLPILFMGRKMRSFFIKQPVDYNKTTCHFFKTTRRLQQNDPSVIKTIGRWKMNFLKVLYKETTILRNNETEVAAKKMWIDL